MDAAASAAFHLLEPEWQDYKAIHFDTSNGRILKKRLAEKTKALARLEKDYTQVLTYGSGDWGIAALARIGMGYQDLAQNFLDAPTPKNLNADQQEMYKSVLQEKAFPLQDKAIEAFEKALSKSYELSVYNQWTLDAQNDLLKFKPDAYQPVHEGAVLRERVLHRGLSGEDPPGDAQGGGAADRARAGGLAGPRESPAVG